MTTSSYENGWRDGEWTPSLVRQCGFRSARECLAHQEQVYRKEVEALPRLQNRAYAARQAEYLEGWIAASRQSLGRMK